MTCSREDGLVRGLRALPGLRGRGRRSKRSGRSKAEASRRAEGCWEVLGATGGSSRRDSTSRRPRGLVVDVRGPGRAGLAVAVDAGRVPLRGQPGRHARRRSLRLGEVTTPRLDHFVQAVLAERGYATAKVTRSVLSGVCGWLVRRGALRGEPGAGPDAIGEGPGPDGPGAVGRGAAGMAGDSRCDEFARRHDLPELARFMVATGLRLGEALGVTWADVDLDWHRLVHGRSSG